MVGIIATVDSDEAALALGIKPPTVRKLIREGRLAATRFGRGWRIGVDSINALLTGAKSPSLVQANVVIKPLHDVPAPAQPAQGNVVTKPNPVVPAPAPPVQTSPGDLQWIGYWTRMLNDANPEAVANARWQLEMFKKSAERPKPKPAAPLRPITLAECEALIGSGRKPTSALF